MGHTKPENLADLAQELDAIRELEGIKQRSAGVFYYRSSAFLHFHDQDGRRWADVKTPRGYQEVAIGFDADIASRRRFLKAAREAHAALASGMRGRAG